MSKVLINLKLCIRQPIFIRFKLLWQLRELLNQCLINIRLFELSLTPRPLPYLYCPRDLWVLPDLTQRPLYHSLLDHLAPEVQIITTRL
jgi:hypothetical protein